MERVRVVDDVRGLAPGEHVGWSFDDVVDWRVALAAFLGEGVRRGEALLYHGWDDRPEDDLADDLALLPGRDRLLESGTLRVVPCVDPAVVDLTSRSAELGDAARAAVAEGSGGLRAAHEVTPLLLAHDPVDLVRLELACDRLCVDAGITVMCGYDRRRITAPMLAGEQLVHPVRRRGDPGDWCWLTSQGSGRPWRLSGALDAPLARFVQTCAGTLAGEDELDLDVCGLDFVDTAGVGVLLHLAATRAAATVLHRPSALLGDLLEVMAPALHPALELTRQGRTTRLHPRAERP